MNRLATLFVVAAWLPLGLFAAGCGDDAPGEGNSPAAPTLATATAISANPAPTFTGNAAAGTTISFYLGTDCAGDPIIGATATTDNNGTFTAAIPVPFNALSSVSARARRGTGTPSPCSTAVEYTHDDLPPNAPALVSCFPTSPTSINTLALHGAAEPKSTLLIFDGDCESEALSTTVADALMDGAGVSFSVADDTVTEFRAIAVDAAGNRSVCSDVFLFEEDSTAPPIPTITALTEAGPSPDEQPGILGSAEVDSDVIVFGDASCTGTELARGKAAVINSGGYMVFTPTLNGITQVFVQGEDRAGNLSACGDTGLAYEHDSSAPAAPTVTCKAFGSSPQPTVSGKTVSNGNVAIFTNDDCSGVAAANTIADGEGNYSLTVAVPSLNASTAFSAMVTSPAELTSTCSTPATYVHDDQPPTTPTLAFLSPSPSSSITVPAVSGVGEASVLVEVFTDPTCGLASVKDDLVNPDGTFMFTVPAVPNAHTAISARLTDLAGNASDCATPITWTHDNVAPALALTGLTATGVDSAELGYSALTDNLTLAVDIAVEVCLGLTDQGCTPFVPDLTITTGADAALTVDGALDSDTRYYVWARPRDLADNLGDVVGPVQARTLGTAGTTSLALGSGHGCVATAAGTVRCFGDDSLGQLGTLGNPANQVTPDVEATNLEGIIEVSAGQSHSCARTALGEVYCWGDNTYGQIGGVLGESHEDPQLVSLGGALVTTLALGDNHSCALTVTGSVWCWGRGDLGQLGDGPGTSNATPTMLPSNGFRTIAAGGNHTCTITTPSEVWCWGDDSSGQLGDGPAPGTGPSKALLPTPAIAIAAGAAHSCAVLTDGTTRCWGDNTSSQLGTGSAASTFDAPMPVLTLANTVAVSAGTSHSCALLASGTTYCWGDNTHGQVGDGTTTHAVTRQLVAGVPAFVALAAGGNGSCGVTAAGQAYCWGDDTDGALGVGGAGDVLSPLPLDVTSFTAVQAVIAGNGISGALWTSGAVALWGSGYLGVKGDGNFQGESSATAAVAELASSNGGGIQLIGFGEAHGCALQGAGSVVCWGSDALGQVSGAGGVQTPTVVTGIGAARHLAVGRNHNCIVNASGEVQCWGASAESQVGGNAKTPVVSATQVIEVAAGDHFSCALRANGSAMCWGSPTQGELGFSYDDGVARPASTVPNVFLGAHIVAGRAHACVLQSTGTVTCWGSNSKGQLGSGTLGSIASASAVSDPGPFVELVAGRDHTCGRLLDGQVRCWGDGSAGQLGQGATVPGLVEPQAVVASGVTSIAAGWNHTCVLADGDVRCVGDNDDYQLGDEAVLNLSVDFIDVPSEP